MPLSTPEARLTALRGELARQGLDGFVIPLTDEHMSEYVGAYAQRLAWLTGFGGSAGSAVVLADAQGSPGAAIFVDGRYTLQVRDQVDGRLYAFADTPAHSPAGWLADHAPQGARIGYDPWLHTQAWVDAAGARLGPRGIELVAVAANPVDAVWTDRPAPSLAPAMPHPVALAGESSAAKRAALRDGLVAQHLDAVVIAALDSIAWLLNLRGSDVPRTPVTLSFVIAHADGSADLFIAPAKVTPELAAHLGDEVRVAPREAFAPALAALRGKRVGLDGTAAVAAISSALHAAGAQVVAVRDPTLVPKACKNAAEQAGQRAAQARDGAAVARFLRWLEQEAPRGGVDELSAGIQLHAFRRDTGMLRDLSFDTISGAGPNGAVVHYRVSEETNRRLDPGSVYLVDSGGQYADGTTDITRTVWIASEAEPLPPAEVRDRFTRVLQGHIGIARACFPRGTSGGQLDVLARQQLWAAGLDYAHGTGHGVGSFLAVHEGPQRIGKPAGGQAGTGQELLPGMIVSDEPGYYKAGEYGIRIENLVLVEERDIPGAEGAFLGFEMLTFVPIDRRMVEPAMLSAGERAWWDAYHVQVAAIIGPQLDPHAQAWLTAACAPL